MTDEHLEAKVADLHERVVDQLLADAKAGTLCAADKRVALEIIKYNKVDDGGRPHSPVEDLAANLPFDTVDQEIE